MNRQSYQVPALAPNEVERETIEVNTTSGSVFGPGAIDTVLMNIPKTGNKFLDPKSSWLRGYVSSTTGVGVRHDFNCYALFKEVRIRFGNSKPIVLEEENLRGVMLHKLLPDDYLTSQGVAEGHGSDSQRKDMVSNGMYFALPLHHWLSTESYLPTPFMGNGGTAIQIEIKFAPAVEALVVDSGTPGYSVSGLKMDLDYVKQPDAYLKEVVDMMNAGKPLQIHLESWSHGNETLDSSGNQVLRFGKSVSSAKSVLFVPRPSGNPTSSTARSLSEFAFPTAMEDVQLRIGDKIIPQSQLDCTRGAVLPYNNLMKAVGQYSSFLAGNQLRSYNPLVSDGSDFMLGFPLESHSHIADKVLSGLDLKSKSSPIELNVKWTQAASETFRVDMFVQHDILVVLTPDGISTVD